MLNSDQSLGRGAANEFVSIHDQRVEQSNRSNRDQIDSLGLKLKSEFEDAASRRQMWEERWLRDLRQCKDQYEPDIKDALDKDPTRSQAFVPKTRTKKNALAARLLELFFPANGEQNWNINPSPEPSVSPILVESKMHEMAQSGEDPQGMSRRSIERAVAKEACDRMRSEMQDQLVNRVGRPSYREIIASVVDHGLTYGTGVLKGPLVERSAKDNWIFMQDENRWEMVSRVHTERLPYKEFVSLWDCYPDPDAIEARDMRYHWQTHLKTASDLQEMAKDKYFDGEAISQYLRDHPNGDATLRNHESTLRSMGQENSVPNLKNRYRLFERWGYIKGSDLAEAGVDVPQEMMGFEVPANIWILGSKTIKAVLEPIKGVVIPYYYWYFSKDETSIFGDSLASVLRDPQAALNSTVRAMLDNSAISSGPQVGINMQALHPSNGDPRKIGNWGVWLFDNPEDMQKAMQVWDLPNHINNYLALVNYLTNLMDEITVPRYIQGDGQVGGAGRTAHGLSMLMGAAHIVLKDLVRQFDDRITRPFITALYHWNMQFNERQDIKGDYQIQAIGSTSLVAKEVQTEKLLQVAQITENPRFAGRIKDDGLLQEVFRSMDVQTDLVRSDQEYEAWQERQLLQQERARARASLEVLLDEAQGRGMDPNQILQQKLGEQMMQFQQAQAGAQPAGSQPPGPQGTEYPPDMSGQQGTAQPGEQQADQQSGNPQAQGMRVQPPAVRTPGSGRGL